MSLFRYKMQTLVIGPTVLISPVFGLINGLDLNAAIPWLTPSAKMNRSRSSMFVRPFAI